MRVRKGAQCEGMVRLGNFGKSEGANLFIINMIFTIVNLKCSQMVMAY